MTFEEAWPHIKAGKKEFRVWSEYEGEWSDWHTLEISGEFFLSDLPKLKFEIKPEPREWEVIVDSDGRVIDARIFSKTKETIKVREVIE